MAIYISSGNAHFENTTVCFTLHSALLIVIPLWSAGWCVQQFSGNEGVITTTSPGPQLTMVNCEFVSNNAVVSIFNFQDGNITIKDSYFISNSVSESNYVMVVRIICFLFFLSCLLCVNHCGRLYFRLWTQLASSFWALKWSEVSPPTNSRSKMPKHTLNLRLSLLVASSESLLSLF